MIIVRPTEVACLTIGIINDDMVEDIESFQLELGFEGLDASGVIIGQQVADVFILDNDVDG